MAMTHTVYIADIDGRKLMIDNVTEMTVHIFPSTIKAGRIVVGRIGMIFGCIFRVNKSGDQGEGVSGAAFAGSTTWTAA